MRGKSLKAVELAVYQKGKWRKIALTLIDMLIQTFASMSGRADPQSVDFLLATNRCRAAQITVLAAAEW